METLIRVSTSDSPTKQDVIHNRWHPDIPIVAWVKPGDQFRVECVSPEKGNHCFVILNREGGLTNGLIAPGRARAASLNPAPASAARQSPPGSPPSP